MSESVWGWAGKKLAAGQSTCGTIILYYGATGFFKLIKR